MAPTLPRLTTAPPSSSSDDSNPVPIVISSSPSSADSNHGPAAISSDDDRAACSRRKQPCNQCWIFHDEVQILTALARGRREAGRLPRPSELRDVLRGNLRRRNPAARDFSKKAYSLRERFKRQVAAGGPGDQLRNLRLYELSMKVWPELLPPISVSSASAGTQ